MKTATVKSSLLARTGWDAKYVIAVDGLLKAAGLDENEDNVRLAHPLAKAGVSHVEVSAANSQCDRFSLHWEKDGARFHVWVDSDHKVERHTWRKPEQIIYKNPPLESYKPSDPGYFKTRYLDANKHGELVIAVIHYAEVAGLFVRAMDHEHDKERARLDQIAAERAVERVKEAGPQLLEACKEALLFLTGPDHSATGVRTSPVARANLARMLSDAIEAAETRDADAIKPWNEDANA